MTPRELVRSGRSLVVAQAPTTLAVALVSVVSVLLVAVANARATWLAHEAFARLDLGLLVRAGMVLLVGASFAGLALETARAVALARQGGGTKLDGVARTPAMISVVAVELTVEAMLLFGATMGLLRHHASAPATAALQATLLFFPALILCAIVFAAARVAVLEAARGAAAAEALIRGFDLVFRRWRALVALGARLAWTTLPLTLGALVAGVIPHPVGAALRALLLALAWLWAYASLGGLVDDAA
jgi:hypothetical protein